MFSERVKILALVLIGLSLGWTVTQPGWEPLTVLVGAVAAYLTAHFKKSKYGIKITSPNDGDTVSGYVNVEGTLKRLPPDDYKLLLFNVSEVGGAYWPQVHPVRVDEAKKTWTGVTFINHNASIVIAVVGKCGQVLYDYYSNVLKQAPIPHSFPPIEKLPDDINECHRVFVKYRDL